MLSSRVQATWLMELVGGARRRLRALAAAASSTGHDSTSDTAHMLLTARPFRCRLQICRTPGFPCQESLHMSLRMVGKGEGEHSITQARRMSWAWKEAAHPDAAILSTGGDALAVVAELQQQHIMSVALEATELCGCRQAPQGVLLLPALQVLSGLFYDTDSS